MQNSLFFDWYSCTIDLSINTIMDGFSSAYPCSTWERGRGRNGYLYGADLLTPDAKNICRVFWGGDSQGTACFVESSGESAETFSRVVRRLFPVHRLSRADIACDFVDAGAWLSLSGLGVFLSKKFNLVNRYVGEHGAHDVDSPLIPGRTLYVGSRSSVHYLRIYEKGKKECAVSPDWVRFEMEFKPRGIARERYSSATHSEMLAATRQGADALRILFNGLAVRPCPAGSVRGLDDRERTLRALKKQYGNFIRLELERLGGDYSQLVQLLLEVA